MALNATILKAELQISDLNRSHFENYNLTIAQHPSETPERVMIRLLAFALNAESTLEFGRGISNEDEATIWSKNPNGEISHWIEVGLPDETRIKKALARSNLVSIYTYGRTASLWIQKNTILSTSKKINITTINPDDVKKLVKVYKKSMKLQWTIQENQVYLEEDNIYLEHHYKSES